MESIALVLLAVVALRAAGPEAVGNAIREIGIFVARVAWPITVLTIFAIFRHPIRQFITEMAEVTFPGGSAKRGDAAARQLREDANAVAEATEARAAEGEPHEAGVPLPRPADEPPRPQQPPEPKDEAPAPAPAEEPEANGLSSKNPVMGQLDLQAALRRLGEANDRDTPYAQVLHGYAVAAFAEAQLVGGSQRMSYGRRLGLLRKAGAPNEILALGNNLRKIRDDITNGKTAVTPVGANDYLTAVERYVLSLASWAANRSSPLMGR